MKVVSAVFWKEMISLSRGKRHYFTRALFLGALLTVMAVIWSDVVGRSGGRGFTDTSYIGRSLFTVFTYTQLIAVAILIPALTAPVISAEKDKDTLGLLLMSNLSVYNVLLDKLLSRMALIVVLLLSGLPIFFALLAFGGIMPKQILGAYVGILGTMFFCGGLGILFSTLLNKTYSALIVTYVAITGYVFMVVWLANEYHLYRYWDVFLPVFDDNNGVSAVFFSWTVVVLLFSVLISARLLPKMVGRRKRHLLRHVSGRMNAFFERINFTGINVMKEEGELGDNAIMWKESQKHFFGSRAFIVRSSYALIILSLIVLIMGGYDAASVIPPICLIGLMIVAVVSSATAFTAEHESHSFEVLMASPLTARRIVLAKFVGVLKPMIPLLVCMFGWLLVDAIFWGMNARDFYYGHWRDDNDILSFLSFTTSQIPMLVVIGLYSGTVRRRNTSAILQTFLITVAWSVVALLPELLHDIGIFGYRGYGIFDNDLREALLCMAPLSSFMWMLDNSDDFISLASAILIPCWIVLLLILVRMFDRLVGRR